MPASTHHPHVAARPLHGMSLPLLSSSKAKRVFGRGIGLWNFLITRKISFWINFVLSFEDISAVDA